MIIYRKMKAEDVPFISRLEEETFSMPWSHPLPKDRHAVPHKYDTPVKPVQSFRNLVKSDGALFPDNTHVI